MDSPLREIFRFCFDIITDPLSLPVNPLTEFIFLALISQLAYEWAYGFVGDLYHANIISGRSVGSFLHWLFRYICYVVVWAIINTAIYVYQFITEHWIILLAYLGSILMLIASIVVISHLVSQRRQRVFIQMNTSKDIANNI